MALRPKDPLLAAARVLLLIAMAAMAMACLATLVAAPALVIFQSHVLAELASNAVPSEALWALVLVVLLVAVITALGFLFFRHMHRMVGTVGQGDPFIPDNARRLNAMGWIVVAVQGLCIPLVAVLRWLERMTEKIHSGADSSLDLEAILLALILFILARVFREGTRLRDEVEGTV